jgi:chromosome partitioning protein
VIQQVKDKYDLHVYSNYIPDNIAVEEAHHRHQPVHTHAPRSAAAQAYMSLASELWI